MIVRDFEVCCSRFLGPGSQGTSFSVGRVKKHAWNRRIAEAKHGIKWPYLDFITRMKNLMVLTFSSKTWYDFTLFLLHNKNILLVGVYIWIRVLDYLK